MDTRKPPSNLNVAPLTNAPAALDKKRAAPATSSGLPMRFSGIDALRTSPTVSSVWAVTTSKQAERQYCQSLGSEHSYFCSGKGRTQSCSIQLPRDPVYRRGGGLDGEAQLWTPSRRTFRALAHLALRRSQSATRSMMGSKAIRLAYVDDTSWVDIDIALLRRVGRSAQERKQLLRDCKHAMHI